MALPQKGKYRDNMEDCLRHYLKSTLGTVEVVLRSSLKTHSKGEL